MKVLLDICVWGGAKEALAAAGHEVEWVGDRERDPGDEAIIEHAFTQGMVLVTLDKDFGELAIVMGRKHRGIVRLVSIRGRDQGAFACDVLEKYAEELAKNAILTVYADRTRVRTPED